MKTAAAFVTGMQAHNAFGIPSAMKHIDKAVEAAETGQRKRARIRAAAEQLAAVRAVHGK
jgi:hypothetical protein